MRQWTYETHPTSRGEIETAVTDSAWQKFRLSLKGIPTEQKLDKLKEWQADHEWDRYSRVQVQNYVNALKRGGQLDMFGHVLK